MTNVLQKIHFDSNLMREPAAFAGLATTVAVSGICRDVMIWAAAQPEGLQWLVLNVPAFCRQFGYSRQLLLRKLAGSDKAPGVERKEMTKARFFIDEKTGRTMGKNVLDYALFTLVRKNLIFEDGYTAVDEAGDLVRYETATAVNLVQSVRVKRSKQGTEYAVRLHECFVRNCRGKHYTSFTLADYLNITTATGTAWEAGRRLYLRLVWKIARMEWQRKKPRKERADGYQLESYQALKVAAGLNFEIDKKNAAQLRTMLRKVMEAGGLGFEAEVKLVQEYGKQPYQVKLSRKRKQTVENVL